MLGYNYRMTDIQAAVGREQLRRLPGIVARRREIADIYKSLLSPRPVDRPAAGARLRQVELAILRRRACRTMPTSALSCRRCSTPASPRAAASCARTAQDGYKNGNHPPLLHSEGCQDRTIVLPLYPQMTMADLELVASTLKKATDGEVA